MLILVVFCRLIVRTAVVHTNMSNMAHVEDGNVKFIKNEMNRLFETLDLEVDQLELSASDTQRHKIINARIHRAFDLFSTLVVQLISGKNQINEDKLNDVIAEHSKLQDNYNKLEEELIQTKIENDAHQQSLKCDSIRLHNVSVPTPPTHDQRAREDVVNTVLDYMKDANIPLERADIKSAYRPRKEGQPGHNIYVSFLRGFDRVKILRQRKTKMTDNQEFKRKRPNSIITEDLTPLRQLISYKLRQDKQNVKTSWSIDGKIKCIRQGQGDHDQPISINTPYDLTKVGWQPSDVKKFIRENMLKNLD